MPTRAAGTEYLPSPPFGRIGRGGRVTGRTSIKTSASNTGVKNNMCVAPATNGSREHGLASSQPASATKGMGVSPTISG